MEGLFEEVTFPRRKEDRMCENLGKAHQDRVSAGRSLILAFLPAVLLGQQSAQHRWDWLDQSKYPGLDCRSEKECWGDNTRNFTQVWRVVMVWMDVNFLVLMTVPWLWKMLTFGGTERGSIWEFFAQILQI